MFEGALCLSVSWQKKLVQILNKLNWPPTDGFEHATGVFILR